MESVTHTNYQNTDGVLVSDSTKSKFLDFEALYIGVRTKEKRVLTTEQIRNLPFVPKTSDDSTLWALRRKTIDRFIQYLASKKQNLKSLISDAAMAFLQI